MCFRDNGFLCHMCGPNSYGERDGSRVGCGAGIFAERHFSDVQLHRVDCDGEQFDVRSAGGQSVQRVYVGLHRDQSGKANHQPEFVRDGPGEYHHQLRIVVYLDKPRAANVQPRAIEQSVPCKRLEWRERCGKRGHRCRNDARSAGQRHDIACNAVSDDKRESGERLYSGAGVLHIGFSGIRGVLVERHRLGEPIISPRPAAPRWFLPRAQSPRR